MKTYQTPKTSSLALLGLVFCFVSTIPARAEDAAKLISTEDPAALKVPEVTGPEIWKDPTQPLNARVHDLVSRMSLAEKVSQMDCVAPAIPRLGIPAYSYRNECLHGRRTINIMDFNTVFPQAIGMAATWDVPLIHEEADVISIEVRAAHNDYVKKHDGDSTNSFGLTCYTPNINIFRDPR
jgi:beta-glucosidase